MAQKMKDSSKNAEITEAEKIMEVVKMDYPRNKNTAKYAPVMTIDFGIPSNASSNDTLIDQIMTPKN